MHFHRHLSDLRTGLLLRGSSIGANALLVRKTDLCAKTLAAAARLASVDRHAATLGRLLRRARELLDDLDESLLTLDHDRDRPVFTQLAVLQARLRALETLYDDRCQAGSSDGRPGRAPCADQSGHDLVADRAQHGGVPGAKSRTMSTLEPHDRSHQASRQRDGADYLAVINKAELCAAALVEAQRLSAAALFGTTYAQLDHRVRDMLDELDDALLLLDLRTHRDAYERVAALHAVHEEVQYRRDAIGV